MPSSVTATFFLESRADHYLLNNTCKQLKGSTLSDTKTNCCYLVSGIFGGIRVMSSNIPVGCFEM